MRSRRARRRGAHDAPTTRQTMARALYDWLETIARGDVRVRDATDLFDGRALERAVCEITGARRRDDDDDDDGEGDDSNLNRLRELLLEHNMPGACGMVDALVARDEKGAQRLLREVYAEHLSRRVARFTLERSFGDASGETSSRVDEVSNDDDDDGDAIDDDEGVILDDFCDVEDDEWVDDGEDETDLTADWVALATPEKTSNVTDEARVSSPGFVKASDVLAQAFDACVVSPVVAAKKTFIRKHPSPVPKKLTLQKTPPKKPAAPVTWDIVFDEPKSTASMPRWVPGASTSDFDVESPPSAPPPRADDDIVTWLGDKTNSDSLRLAAERRGRLRTSSSVSPKSTSTSEHRRRSDGGCVPSYVPAPRPSNKRVIRNALRSVCLAGPINLDAYVEAAAAIDACDEPSVVILFKGAAHVAPKKMRGLYAVEDETTLRLIHGSGPRRLLAKDVATTMKYDTATQDFISMANNDITPIVAAISVTPGN